MTTGGGTRPSTVEPSSIQVVGETPPRGELSKLWTRVHDRPWNWIAVVPADPDLSALPLARALQNAWNWLSEFAVRLRVADKVDVAATAALVHQLRHGDRGRGTAGSATGSRVEQTLVAVESPLKNPMVLPIILSADGVILCAARGSTPISAVRSAVDMIGREHILACVLLD